MRNISYAQAVAEATDQAMELDPNVIVIGQGTRDRGYIFGTIAGLFDKYGPERIIEMPLSEPAIAGIRIGAALQGQRPVLILQRADFAFLIMDQLMNHASKWHFMFGGERRVPLTVRLVVGKGWGQGPQHSQSLHATFGHFPGFRVVLPTQPDDAKGLLLNSIFSDDPTIFIEGRPLHPTIGDVRPEPYVTPFGRARVLRPGSSATIVACSYLVPEALKAAEGLDAEVIDVVSASPIDFDTILASVARTRRLLVADTSWEPFGLASEISAGVSERLYGKLAAPVRRLALPFHPSPTAAAWERTFYPDAERITQEIKTLCAR